MLRNVLHIFPAMTIDNHFNSGGGNSELLSKLRASVLARLPKPTDFKNLLNVQDRTASTAKILDECDRFQMIRIHTASVSAKMIELQTIRYLAFVLLVQGTVRHFVASSVAHTSIPFAYMRPIPLPTSRFLIHRVVVRGIRVLHTAMSANIALRCSANVPSENMGLLGDHRLLSTAAHAQTAWVRAFQPFTRLSVFVDSRVIAFPTQRAESITAAIDARALVKLGYRQFAIATRAVFDRLLTWHFESSRDSRCRRADGCLKQRVGFSLPQLYQKSPSLWGFRMTGGSS